MEQAGVQLIAQGANVYIGDMKSATHATDAFVDGTEKGGRRVSAAGQVMIGALRDIGRMATQAFVEAARATAAFIGDSIGLAGDFEQGMREFQAVAGSDVDTSGLEQFKDLFLDIGKRLPVSTKEVQKAAIEMVKGGIDPAIIAAGGLEQNIQFAAAAMKGDLVGAAEISAKILGGWTRVGATAAEQAEFLTHSTDLLTKAANASTVDVKELALGIFNAQGIAKVAGVSFDDLTTTLAALSPRFESASQAGNSLKNMIARLQPTTKPATVAMRSLGLITEEGNNKFYDAAGNFVGMSKAGQLLQDSLKGLTKQQKAAVLQTIFGNDAMGSAAGLAELGAAGYEEMAAKMEKANGVAATAALIQGSFNTKLDNAKGSIEALQITIGSALLPILGDLLDNYISPAINAVTTFADKIFSATDPLLTFAQSIGALSPELSTIAFYLIDLLRNGEDLGGWLATTPALFQDLVGVVQAVSREFVTLSDAFDQGGISGLIDQLLSDIGAAIPGIQAALLGWGQALIDWIAPYIPPMLDALGDAVDTAWDWVVDQVPQWIAQLGEWGQAFVDFVAPYIPPLLDELKGLVVEAGAWIKGEAPKWGQQLLAWGDEFVAWIQPAIPPMLAELGRLGDQFLGWIGDQAAPLLKRFLDWKDAFVAWIPGATVQFLAEWPKVLDEFLDWIGESAGPLLLQLGDWALSFTEWIIPMIPGFLKTLGAVTIALGIFIAETAVVLSKKVLEWTIAMTGWIVTDAIPRLAKALGALWSDFNDWGMKLQDDIGKWMMAVGKSLVDGIKSGVSNAWSSFTGWVHDRVMELPAAVRAALGISSPSKVFAEIGRQTIAGWQTGWQTGIPAAIQAVRSGAETFIETFIDNDIADTLMGLGMDAMDGFADGLAKGMKVVVKEIDEISKGIEDRFKDATESWSPSQRMVPIGQSIMQGIMMGMTETLPALKDQIAAISEDLASQFEGIGESIQDAIASGFGATASIDRQIAKNLDSFKDIPDAYRMYTEGALLEAQSQATGFLDPTEGAKFFAMRSKQILEYSKLQKELNEAATEEDRKRIEQQMLLINAAQTAEIAQYNATMAGKQSITEEIMSQINALMAGFTEFDLTDEQIKMVDQLATMLDQLRPTGGRNDAYANPTEWMADVPNYMAPVVSPPPTPVQLAPPPPGKTRGDTSTTNVNMPIYTNNSPAALQQSWAVMQASMP